MKITVVDGFPEVPRLYQYVNMNLVSQGSASCEFALRHGETVRRIGSTVIRRVLVFAEYKASNCNDNSQ